MNELKYALPCGCKPFSSNPSDHCEEHRKLLGENVCPNCHQEIDPDVCWCGDSYKNHGYDGHSFVPMGCNCHRVKEGE